MTTSPAPRKLKRPSKPTFDLDGFVARLKEWASIKAIAEDAASRHAAANKDDLKPLVIAHGEHDPETGNKVLAFPEPITLTKYGKVDAIVAQATHPRSLNVERVTAFLAERTAALAENPVITSTDDRGRTTSITAPEGIDLVEEATEVVRAISEDKLLAVHYRGFITEEELDDLYDVEPPRYSFTVRKAK